MSVVTIILIIIIKIKSHAIIKSIRNSESSLKYLNCYEKHKDLIQMCLYYCKRGKTMLKIMI